MKRIVVWFSVVGGLGLITAITLTVIEGMNYRLREQQGLDPVWASPWVSTTTIFGIGLFAISAIVLLAIAVSPAEKTGDPTTPR
ncbi:hypothetical protein NYA9BBAC_02734 [Salinibacterium sp. NYA9b]